MVQPRNPQAGPAPFLTRETCGRIEPAMETAVDPILDRPAPATPARETRLRHLAWPLGVLGLLISATTATLVFLNRSAIHALDQANPIEVILPIGYSIMGALLVSRRSRNPVGWIFLGIGLFTGLPGVATQYAFRSAHFHALPAVAWVGRLVGLARSRRRGQA